MSAASASSADSDALPSIVQGLLKQLSEECVRGDGAVRSTEHKLELQTKLRKHAHERSAWIRSQKLQSPEAEPAAAASFSLHVDPPSESLSLASVPAFVASASAASSASADSLDLPIPGPSTLMRQLSLAAHAGAISSEFKEELKSLLLTAPAMPGGVLSQTRLVRGVSARGEPLTTAVKMDLTSVDDEECAILQQDERDAIQAIYENLAEFSVSNEDLEEAAEVDEAEEKEHAAAGESKDSSDDDDGTAQQMQCCRVRVKVYPFPASGPERNLISSTLEFTLPPLYPFVRPGFELASLEGQLTATERAILHSLVSAKVDELYSVEPVPAGDARVVLFDLIQVAQDFLVEFQDFLEDAAYHSALAAEEAARKAVQDKIARKEADRLLEIEESISHAAAYTANLNSSHLMRQKGKTPLIESSSESRAVLKDPAEEAARLQAQREAEEEKRVEAEFKRLAAQREAQRLFAEEAATRSEFLRKEAATGEATATFASIRPSPDHVIAHIEATDRALSPQHRQAFRTGQAFFEDIASPFLIYRFMKARKQMSAENQPIEVSIGFHGTQAQHVDSIAKNGLIVPGAAIDASGTVLGHRTDVGFYGKGIYLAPNVSFSLGYGGLNNLFCCLVLRGRAYTAAYSLGRGLEPGYDSHVSDSQQEWILFNSAAVLPLYLIKGTVPTHVTSVTPPAKMSKLLQQKKFSAKPPLASKSAQLLLAQIQKETADAKSKMGPVSSKTQLSKLPKKP